LSPRAAAAGLGAMALALVLAGAPGAGPESAAGRAVAGPEAGRVDAAAAPKDRTARRRCQVRRRSACFRVRRLRQPRIPERLTQIPTQPTLPNPSNVDGEDPSVTAPAPSLPRFLSVSSREWSLTLSRPVVGAGSVTVELRNVGEDPHNLVVSPDDGSHAPLAEWAETAPGEHLRRAVTLTAGRYLLFCSLEGHEAAGMSARLRVE
jgi:hypothetical protein